MLLFSVYSYIFVILLVLTSVDIEGILSLGTFRELYIFTPTIILKYNNFMYVIMYHVTFNLKFNLFLCCDLKKKIEKCTFMIELVELIKRKLHCICFEIVLEN